MKPIPEESILDEFVFVGVYGGRKRWRDIKGRHLYEWDGVHGHIEVYTKKGWHLGALDPVTGAKIDDAVKGRRIDV